MGWLGRLSHRVDRVCRLRRGRLSGPDGGADRDPGGGALPVLGAARLDRRRRALRHGVVGPAGRGSGLQGRRPGDDAPESPAITCCAVFLQILYFCVFGPGWDLARGFMAPGVRNSEAIGVSMLWFFLPISIRSCTSAGLFPGRTGTPTAGSAAATGSGFDCSGGGAGLSAARLGLPWRWRATPRTTLALARVAAGGARWWLTATRSGAERADGPVVLAAGAHRGTRCAPCGRYAQTAAMRMLTKCAARTAPASALLGAPLKSPPPGTACRDALLWWVWGRGPDFPSLAPALLAGVTGGCTGAAGIIRACHIVTRTNHGGRANPMVRYNIICAIGGRHGAAARRAGPGRRAAPAVFNAISHLAHRKMPVCRTTRQSRPRHETCVGSLR
jgi:hypothetical protein